jgi:DNA-binding transcriptional ArsR family regulator
MRTITARAATARAAAQTSVTDIPRTPRLNREQREAWVIALYLGGATVDEIAFALGAARAWVRQSVMDANVARHRGTRNIDVLAVLREVRRSGTLTLREVAARLRYSEETVRYSITALGMTESVRRLFRLRRRAARRVAAAGAVVAVASLPVGALDSGRTPTVRVA